MGVMVHSEPNPSSPAQLSHPHAVPTSVWRNEDPADSTHSRLLLRQWPSRFLHFFMFSVVTVGGFDFFCLFVCFILGHLPQ